MVGKAIDQVPLSVLPRWMDRYRVVSPDGEQHTLDSGLRVIRVFVSLDGMKPEKKSMNRWKKMWVLGMSFWFNLLLEFQVLDRNWNWPSSVGTSCLASKCLGIESGNLILPAQQHSQWRVKVGTPPESGIGEGYLPSRCLCAGVITAGASPPTKPEHKFVPG